MTDVLPLSIGVQTAGNTMDRVLPRLASIPYEQTRQYKTTKENMQRITINVRQGESDEASKNHSLGKFAITNIPPGPAGSWIFNVTLRVDEDNVLKVTADRED